jgi:signal transduction histidine kinase
MEEDQTVNHEFINSLASIKCLTELLADYPCLDSGDRSRLLNIMRQQAERLVKLSKELRGNPVGVGSL